MDKPGDKHMNKKYVIDNIDDQKGKTKGKTTYLP